MPAGRVDTTAGENGPDGAAGAAAVEPSGALVGGPLAPPGWHDAASSGSIRSKTADSLLTISWSPTLTSFHCTRLAERAGSMAGLMGYGLSWDPCRLVGPWSARAPS